tara:strand:+ start:4334 stop:4765 length:432 start_codon:yes stop_codon:yes gene_type:complete
LETSLALLGLVVNVVLVRLMMFRVNVEWCIVMSEHVAEFVSHEAANVIGIGAFKPHVEPSIAASLFGLSVALSPEGSEDTETEFLVVVKLELFGPIHCRHFVNEVVQGLEKRLHVLRGRVFVGWNSIVFLGVFVLGCHRVRMP